MNYFWQIIILYLLIILQFCFLPNIPFLNKINLFFLIFFILCYKKEVLKTQPVLLGLSGGFLLDIFLNYHFGYFTAFFAIIGLIFEIILKNINTSNFFIFIISFLLFFLLYNIFLYFIKQNLKISFSYLFLNIMFILVLWFLFLKRKISL
ncbi:MAG: hypothetical protein ACP5H7_00585 [Minisyncoccia bacterium]